MTRRRRIVLVSPRALASFVKQDERLLSSAFDVDLIAVTGLRSVLELRRRIAEADAVLIWFLGRHAIPAIHFAGRSRKPIAAVVGGFEVAWESDIGYGIRPGSLKDRVSGWMLKKAQAILTVSQYSHSLAVARFPPLAGRMRRVYNAVDTSAYVAESMLPRSGVLCVATLTSHSIRDKRLDLIRAVAAASPDVNFTLVGPALDDVAKEFVKSLPNNMVWTGPFTGGALIEAYQRASVFYLPSRKESFSLVLAESMSCGCVPVISAYGALPEVGGPDAIVLEDLDVPTSVAAIQRAMRAPDDQRQRLRKHIQRHFDIERRKDELTRLMTELIDQ